MIFDRQINRRIKKKNLFVIYVLFSISFSHFLSLSLICRPSRLELFLIVYHHLVSFILLFLTLTTTSEKKKKKKRAIEREREQNRTTNYFPCSSFSLFFFYIQHHSFIIFFTLSLSPFRLLSIKYYPEATRTEETQHHTDCFDYSMKNGIKTSATQSRYPYTSMLIE